MGVGVAVVGFPELSGEVSVSVIAEDVDSATFKECVLVVKVVVFVLCVDEDVEDDDVVDDVVDDDVVEEVVDDVVVCAPLPVVAAGILNVYPTPVFSEDVTVYVMVGFCHGTGKPPPSAMGSFQWARGVWM